MHRLDDHKDPDHVWQIMVDAEGYRAFDVGANIGQSTKVLADGFMQVIAFEPCEESYKFLQQEKDINVVALPMAATDFDGDLKLTISQASIGTGQLTTGEGLHWGPTVGERIVQGIKLDTVAWWTGPPSFVKIDTEGHEVAVVRGGIDLFSTEKPELLIEVHKQENEQPIRDLLPWYKFRKLEHGTLRPWSEIRINHFWLHGAP